MNKFGGLMPCTKCPNMHPVGYVCTDTRGGEMSEQNKWKQKHDSMFQKSRKQREKYETEIAKLKEFNGELTSALYDIVTASNITEAKIAVIRANTLLQSEVAK